MLPVKVVSPPYIPVMLCVPAASVLVPNVATPLAFSVPGPSTVLPSLKVTVPVGTSVSPFNVEVTVAVKVTCCPKPAGLAEEVTTVVLPVCPVTVTICAAEVLTR